MFSKAFVASVVSLALSVQVAAHAALAPGLGNVGFPARGGVLRPTSSNPCGGASLANLDSSTAVQAAADGTFVVAARNYNGGVDGSLQFTMTVDPTGTGNNFVPGTVKLNGKRAPAGVTNAQIIGQLPPGTTCTGGASGNLCLVSFVSAGGFGNCVVVQQSNGGGNTGTGNTGSGTASANAAAAASASDAAASASASAAAGAGSSPMSLVAVPASGNTGNAGMGPSTADPSVPAPVQGNKSVKKANKAAKKVAKQLRQQSRLSKRFAAAGSRAPRALIHAIRAAEQEQVLEEEYFDEEFSPETPEIKKRGLASWIWA